MTEDFRDTAQPPLPGEEQPAEPVPATATESGADSFAAETMAAERLVTSEAPDYKDRWLRAEAELQNTRRRAARDRDDAVRSAEDRVLLDLIELLDDLERALASLAPEAANEAWAQGVSLTAQRMRDALARRGVTVLATLGQPFDPAVHEALLEVPATDGAKPGHIVKEVLRGYRRGERALRAARVIVARTDG